ncbi:MAG: amino acid synthesis family protein [Woeseiaceae bacterium]|jgi:hypothetical protein|nr:amino acid synthesis family protein [Woeseiaceae bacterium]
MNFNVRKIVITLDRSNHEFGPPKDKPLILGGICGIVSNPFAGQYVEILEPAMKDLEPLGLQLANELLEAMNCGPDDIEAYGKGCIVGVNGELEHGALWHSPGGYGMRQVLGETRAIVPSTKKVGPVGATIDIPLAHTNAAYVRNHFHTLPLQVPDAPRPDELVFCLAMATGSRIHARMGGLQASNIIGEDGLR